MWEKITYDSVDWATFGEVFTKLLKGKQMSYTKLTHGLLNTNEQNFKFYNGNRNCPCFLNKSGTITHLFTCQETKTKANHTVLLDKLNTTLAKLGTHKCILLCIQYGLNTYERNQHDHSNDNHAPTYGSLHPLGTTLTQASWIPSLIIHILDYSAALWTYWNGVKIKSLSVNNYQYYLINRPHTSFKVT